MSILFEGPSDEVDYASTVDYEVVQTQEAVDAAALDLGRSVILAVDTENAGIDPHSKWPLLLQISSEEKCYIFEAYGEKLDMTPIKALLESTVVLKLFFQAKYDWKWIFVHWGIRIQNIFCCQVAERLLTVGMPGARRRSSLVEVVQKYLGITLHKEVRSGFINRDPEVDPITEAEFKYAAADVLLLEGVYRQQQDLLGRLNLTVVGQLEFDVLPVFAKSEVAGVYVDKDKWRSLLDIARERHRRVSTEVYAQFDSVIAQKTLFGVPTFNIGSQLQLLRNLKKLGFDLPDTEEATLKKYKEKHPVFKILLKWRGLNKITTSYGEKFLARINSVTGWLHCQFNQVEADTGRVSSSGPNLQQVLSFDPNDPESLDFRSCFTARLGYVLITADYSQQELRILADMSGDLTFRKAYTTFDDEGNELDVHTYTASEIFDTPYGEVSPKQRKQAKVLNFFLVYGGGAYSLALTLGISEDAAQKIINDYFQRYRGIKTFLNAKANAALNNGYSETVSGRKRFLALPSSDDPMFRLARAAIKRKGANSVIQGGAADVTKQGMVFVDRALKAGGYDATILMVVHDELVVEVREDQAKEAAKIVEDEMCHGFTHFFHNIPMRVDATISHTWEKD